MSHFFTHSALTLNDVGTAKAKKYHGATAAKHAKAVNLKNHLFAAG